MQRVAIIGCSGAGKTALAVELGRLLGLPVVHLDQAYWRPGWAMPGVDEWMAIHCRLLEGDRWIIDGNYQSTLEARVRRADTVIWLDYGRRVCLARAVRRWFTSWGRTRPDMAPGCPEHVDLPFLAYIWGFRRRQRPRILGALAALPRGVKVHRVCDPGEVPALLELLDPASAA